MLKSYRPRKISYRSPYSRLIQPKKRISPLWLLLALPLSVIALEGLSHLILNVTNKKPPQESALTRSYRLKFLTGDQKEIEGLPSTGELAVKRSSSVGFELVKPQKTEFWQINDQGFREKTPVPLAKPAGEFRIFILGGSTAFGQGVDKQEKTISQYLQTLLQQRVNRQKKQPEIYRPDVFPFFVPDRQRLMKLPPKIKEGNYRVINAAVPGYTSGNELRQLVLQILPYKPDLIVVLHGYQDLILPSNQTQSEIPKIDDFLHDATAYHKYSLEQSGEGWLNNTGIMRLINSYKDKPASSLEQDSLSLPSSQDEFKQRLLRLQNNQKQMIQLSAGAGVPIVIALQPEITGVNVKKLSGDDQAIRNKLSSDYRQKMPQTYGQFIKTSLKFNGIFPNQVKVVSLYGALQNPKQKMFQDDAIHLTEQGNKVVAAKLYYTITGWQKIQLIPQNFFLKTNSKK